LQQQPTQEQADAIAKMCNEKGITKEQLAKMIYLINGNKN